MPGGDEPKVVFCTTENGVEHIARALDAGASDADTQLAVMIAAAFCMYNRYVDGLATVPLADDADHAG